MTGKRRHRLKRAAAPFDSSNNYMSNSSMSEQSDSQNNHSHTAHHQFQNRDDAFLKMEYTMSTFESLLLYHYPDLYHLLSFHSLEPVVYFINERNFQP